MAQKRKTKKKSPHQAVSQKAAKAQETQKRRKKSKKTSKKNLQHRKIDKGFLILVLIGVGILAYPLISNGYYKWVQHQTIGLYNQQNNIKSPGEKQKKREEMDAYNRKIAEDKYQELQMPFSEVVQDNEKKVEKKKLGEVIGVVEVPTIAVKLPIYLGTTETQLHNGAGLLVGTSLPSGGENTHAVITGHRGLPSAKFFTDLPQVKVKDRFFIHLPDETHAYEVDQTKVVTPEDMSDLMIVEGQDYVTLLTCTPYMINTHRLLVRGHRVPYDQTEYEQLARQGQRNYWKELAMYGLGFMVVALFLWWRGRRKKKRRENIRVERRES